ncbi:MAG: AbrB/MazE/SpoVT family DNA-binding domain-containing protein [Blastocatellia bacterium]
MELLVVDTEGRIVIPAEAIKRAGLHPGDKVEVERKPEGLVIYYNGRAVFEILLTGSIQEGHHNGNTDN